MTAVRRVLVVGGGPAGMTAAIALGQVGIEVLVVERTDGSGQAGVGLALQNSPLRALHQLGLLEAVVEHSYHHDAVDICAPDGTVVHRVVTEPLVPGTPSFVALPRTTLARVLERAAAAVGGVQLRYGVTVTAVRDEGDHVAADLDDGTTVQVDLVVGADGIHSAVRGLVFPDAPEPRRARQVIWRGSAPRPPGVDRYVLHDLGTAGRAAVVPMSDEEVYLWLLHPDDGAPRPSADESLARLRERLAPLGGSVPAVAAALRPEVDVRSLQAVLVPAPWFRGGVVLIGDAAHATTPQIAYGAGMAIEDSVVLAEELTRDAPVEEALQAFVQRRFDRCRLVVETSWQLSEWEVDPPEDPSVHQALVGRALAALALPL